MLTKKKKLSKKEIKQDKLVETYYKAYSFFEQNSQRVILYGGIFVAVILAAIFYVKHKSQQNQLAGVELSRVMNMYDSGNYMEAIQGRPGTPIIGLKKIVDEYGSTENGETAKIYLANAYSFQNKMEDAYKYYSDYSGSISMYEATAYAGQGAYFVDKKEFEKAAEMYTKAAHTSDQDVLDAEYLLKAGINYMKAGQNKEAKESFDKVKKDYENSAAARDVQKYLVQLN
ncbi:MAG TPA: hypothetical protein VJ954_06125 [Ignavibacteriaceae bacterium]|nr:hypothetical protein [Ignavibacteriaceae bacterium]